MKSFRLFLISSLLFVKIATAQSVNYTLRFPEPQTHYVEVEMQLDGLKGNTALLKLPVWTPGSYLVREYAKNIESVSAIGANNSPLAISKTTKNCWQISTNGASKITVKYKVYAFELTVRTCFIDKEHAYINGAGIFMYADGYQQLPCTVDVVPPNDWKIISVALDPVIASNPWKVKAPNYDLLIDAPFEIGNHTVFTFKAAGVDHEVAMFGEGNYDIPRLKKDMAAIVEEETKIFGEHPCKRYVFIIHNLNSGGGGLEHLNSTTLQTNRWGYGTESGYNGFLTLAAHEYFHLWNVKRMRPKALGPFNYDTENYTNMLYVSEGFTAYYDDLIVRRCGITSPELYLTSLAGNFSYVDNTPGNLIQPVSEASFDAWIKFYRPNENSSNSTISYYTKGSVIGAVLDLAILDATNGVKGLDSVMRMMYEVYYKKLNRGYTDREFMDAVNKVAGKNMDDFFTKYVYGTELIPFQSYLSKAGLTLVNTNEKQPLNWVGAITTFTNNKLTISNIERNSPAWNAGLNVNDELIAMDQYRLGEDMFRYLSMKKPGDKVTFTLSRNNFMKTIDVTIGTSPYVRYVFDKNLKASETEKAMYKMWLHL